MDQTGDDVGIFEIVVVVLSENVGGDDRGKVVSELVVVSAVYNPSRKRFKHMYPCVWEGGAYWFMMSTSRFP